MGSIIATVVLEEEFQDVAEDVARVVVGAALQPGDGRVQVHTGPVGLLCQLRHPGSDLGHLRC